MTVKDIKGWLLTLPEEFDCYPIVIVESISEIENSKNTYLTKHVPVATCTINTNNKEVCLFNEQNINKFDALVK